MILFLAAAALAAQTPATDAACTNVRPAFPAELAGWGQQAPVTAGTKPGDGATITVGSAALVSLHPGTHLALAPKPEKASPAGSTGGTLQLAITEAGTYRIALGVGAWIDLVQGRKSVASVSHGHGPQCTGIRKMVDFQLAPGNYTIQLSGSPSTSLALLVAKIK